jgi:hypothetical protein
MEDEAEQEREEARKLSYYQDNDGMWVINARLSPEAGSLLVKVIEALVAPIQEEKREQLLEQRLQEEVRRKEEENVPAETARRLSCDASLVTVLEDENGKVLNIGRRARTVPASLHRALDVRDKTCRFPGCSETRHVESHHIEHWADGGETSLDNIAKMCKLHHTQLHRGCFDLRVEPPLDDQSEAQLVFTTPSGRRVETDLFPQFSPQVAATAEQALRHAAPEVTATTCVTQWQGEPCDYGMAIEGLLKRDGNLLFTVSRTLIPRVVSGLNDRLHHKGD